MKRLALHLATATLLVTSCSTSTKTESVAPIDSVALKDSLAKVEMKTQDENKVIGDITFGIAEKDFNKKTKSFKSGLQSKDRSYTYMLGNYEFSEIDGWFDETKLYQTIVRGWLIHYDNYKSDLVSQVEVLRTMLTAKYGEPEIGEGAPAWHNTEKGYSYLAYAWNVGKKRIEVRVTNRELYYTADMKIYLPEVSERIAERELKKDQEIAEATKDVL